MLVLARKISESIQIGNEIVIVVTRIAGGEVKLGIQAPPHIRIRRGELTNSTIARSVSTPIEHTAIAEFEPVQFPADEVPALDFNTEYATQIEEQMQCAMAV